MSAADMRRERWVKERVRWKVADVPVIVVSFAIAGVFGALSVIHTAQASVLRAKVERLEAQLRERDATIRMQTTLEFRPIPSVSAGSAVVEIRDGSWGDNVIIMRRGDGAWVIP